MIEAQKTKFLHIILCFWALQNYEKKGEQKDEIIIIIYFF